jgi:hypothetical protein
MEEGEREEGRKGGEEKRSLSPTSFLLSCLSSFLLF